MRRTGPNGLLQIVHCSGRAKNKAGIIREQGIDQEMDFIPKLDLERDRKNNCAVFISSLGR
jgi:hypothetical protein